MKYKGVFNRPHKIIWSCETQMQDSWEIDTSGNKGVAELGVMGMSFQNEMLESQRMMSKKLMKKMKDIMSSRGMLLEDIKYFKLSNTIARKKGWWEVRCTCSAYLALVNFIHKK